MPVTARTERKVSPDSLGLRVFLVVLVSLGLATLEHLVSEDSPESLVYQAYLDSQVYRDQEVSEVIVVPVYVCEHGRGITWGIQPMEPL